MPAAREDSSKLNARLSISVIRAPGLPRVSGPQQRTQMTELDQGTLVDTRKFLTVLSRIILSPPSQKSSSQKGRMWHENSSHGLGVHLLASFPLSELLTFTHMCSRSKTSVTEKVPHAQSSESPSPSVREEISVLGLCMYSTSSMWRDDHYLLLKYIGTYIYTYIDICTLTRAELIRYIIIKFKTPLLFTFAIANTRLEEKPHIISSRYFEKRIS